MSSRNLVSTAALVVALSTVAGPAPAAAQEASCFPACREGFVCSPAGECVSICNPPCGDDEVCTPEATCEPEGGTAESTPPPQTSPQPPPGAQPDQPSEGDWQPSASDEPDAAESDGLGRPGAFRLQLTFDPGFGGEGQLRESRSDWPLTDALKPTLGARIQAHFSLGRYLFLGPSFGIDGFIGEQSVRYNRGRLLVIGLGPVVGVRYPIDLGSVVLEPTGSVTLGYALAKGEFAEVFDDKASGLEFSVRAGVNAWFTETVGAHLDLGYQFHKFFSVPVGSSEQKLALGQLRMGVGLILRFGD